MKLPETKQIQPEQSLLYETKFLSQNKNTTNVLNTDYQDNSSNSHNRDDLDIAVARYLDLDITHINEEYCNDTVHNCINGKAITLETDENSDEDEESYEDTADDFDCNSDFLDDDIVVDDQGNDCGGVEQRQIIEADQKVYNEESFITRVKIQLMLPVGNLTSFDLIAHNR